MRLIENKEGKAGGPLTPDSNKKIYAKSFKVTSDNLMASKGMRDSHVRQESSNRKSSAGRGGGSGYTQYQQNQKRQGNNYERRP